MDQKGVEKPEITEINTKKRTQYWVSFLLAGEVIRDYEPAHGANHGRISWSW